MSWYDDDGDGPTPERELVRRRSGEDAAPIDPPEEAGPQPKEDAMNTVMTTDKITSWVSALRELAYSLEDVSDDDRELVNRALPYATGLYLFPDVWDAEKDETRPREQVQADLGRLARALGGRFDKSDDERFFNLERVFAGRITLQLTAARDAVCEPRVVGTKDGEPVIPPQNREQADALREQLAGLHVPGDQVPVVEYDCPPSLLAAAKVEPTYCPSCGAETDPDGECVDRCQEELGSKPRDALGPDDDPQRVFARGPKP